MIDKKEMTYNFMSMVAALQRILFKKDIYVPKYFPDCDVF